MGEYINIDGKNYVTENDYLDMVKFYENSLKKAYDEVKQLEEGIEGLIDENEKLKEDLAHRDSFFSIMYDVLSNEDINGYLLEDIFTAVIQGECGVDLTEEDKQIYDNFWGRKYV